jgi:hypothetical protein
MDLEPEFVFYNVIFLLKEDLTQFSQERTFPPFAVFKSIIESEVIEVRVGSK